jgi:glucokinase
VTTSEIFAGVDLGGTSIGCAIAGRDGRILRESEIPTRSHQGPRAVLGRIAKALRALGRRPAAVGIGVPGLVDLRRGVTKFLPNLPTQWRGVPVRKILGAALGCPVHLLNDVRTATLGELTYGHGRGANLTMAFFSLGTGVGGGVAVDGKLRLGALGAAGELGHQTIVPDGLPCGCGNRGCLETLASGPALAGEGVRLLRSGLAPRLHALVGGDAGRVTPREMAKAGDPHVREAILRAARHLGIGVANTSGALHPDVVVLGGGVAEIGPLLLGAVRAEVRRRVGMFPPSTVRIVNSKLGPRAGLLGAIALAARGGNS